MTLAKPARIHTPGVTSQKARDGRTASSKSGGPFAVDASRRSVLRGIGGATLGLPFLESLFGGRARGSDDTPHYSVFVRQGNGIAQQDDSLGEVEQWWPRNLGTLTQSGMAADSDRATSVLSGFADQLLMVRNTGFGFGGNGCGHSGGGNQVLTAAQVSAEPSGYLSLGMGESIDNYIARHFTQNGGEPLTLYTGPRYGYIEEVLSYRGPMELRPAEDDPWTAYLRLVGGTSLDPLLQDRRKSVNDLVKHQMDALLGRTDLSTSDRQRLELHFDSVRDFETMACRLSEDEEQTFASMTGQGTLNQNRIAVAKMHADLIALAFSCDQVRTATLQIGDGLDSTEYTINGTTLPSYHHISHRLDSDDASGAPIPGAVDMHHQIDLEMLGVYARLLTRMESYGILDQSIAVFMNDLALGLMHSYENVPWIIAGKGDGTLAQGRYVDGGAARHNKLLNTLITAVGLRKDDGSAVDDFGDPSLAQGTLGVMLA